MPAQTDIILAAGEIPGQVSERMRQLYADQQTSELNRLKLEELMEGRSMRERRRGALQELVARGGTADPDALSRLLLQSGDLEGALGAQSIGAGISKARAAQTKDEAELSKKKWDAGWDIFSAVDDEESFQEARRIAAGHPLLKDEDLSIFGDRFDARRVAQIRKMMLTSKQRADIRFKEQELAESKRRFGLTEAGKERRAALARGGVEERFRRLHPEAYGGEPLKPPASEAPLTRGQRANLEVRLRSAVSVGEMSEEEAQDIRSQVYGVRAAEVPTEPVPAAPPQAAEQTRESYADELAGMVNRGEITEAEAIQRLRPDTPVSR
ncbi:MAG: hypothetical protein ACRD98_00465 [Nitrososphaera sp.]